MTNKCSRLMTVDAHRMVPIDKGLGGCWFCWLLCHSMNGQWQFCWIRSMINNKWWIAISRYRPVFADQHHYPVLLNHSGERMTNDACWLAHAMTVINFLRQHSLDTLQVLTARICPPCFWFVPLCHSLPAVPCCDGVYPEHMVASYPGLFFTLSGYPWYYAKSW